MLYPLRHDYIIAEPGGAFVFGPFGDLSSRFERAERMVSVPYPNDHEPHDAILRRSIICVNRPPAVIYLWQSGEQKETMVALAKICVICVNLWLK